MTASGHPPARIAAYLLDPSMNVLFVCEPRAAADRKGKESVRACADSIGGLPIMNLSFT
jgi:hypothetical protein